ncbi:hypothetical protein BCV72DRAFT_114617 [Rhizopus microsporus var. microsporus]|uniref:Uncharacterized protein n=1 Tax=Rhizopus microsporus var. microsporus TaxID=86635 RepID=A0A1X0RGS6_RHIZD|nr:hypothetical protein BCV72DRAFT_114617 [Rhizopus microsporus var. microsporus]
MDDIITLSEQAIKERCQFFIYQAFESRLKREMINLYKKYPKKESSAEEVLLKDLEEREIVKNSLLNVYKDASKLWNQANGLLEDSEAEMLD